jgi:hypothetical protein
MVQSGWLGKLIRCASISESLNHGFQLLGTILEIDGPIHLLADPNK